MTELKANESGMETPSPTPEDDPGTESEAESDCSKPSVSSKTVEKIVSNLEGAQTDTERLAALFLVTKAVRAEELDAHSRRIIFDAIGFTFLGRLLRAEGEALYKSVALSILTCFCTDPELVVHPQMLANIPVLLGIVADADTEAYQDDLTVVSEAYQCLHWIAGRWKGAQALLKCGAPSKLADIYLAQSFKCEEALAILQTLATRCGDNLWIAETTSMTSLLNKISLEFEADNGEHKFELCRILASVLLSYPRYEIANTDSDVNATWPSSVRRAIFDILRSKVTSIQRDPALRLSSLMVELLGITWAFTDDPAINSGGNTNSATFLLLLAQLSCVEVRMGLEDRSLVEAAAGNGAELLTSCYLVLEAVLGYITAGQQVLELEAKQREQLYCALKGAYGAVLGFLHQEKQSQESKQLLQQHPQQHDGTAREDGQRRLFLCATVRCLCAWLAEETSALRPDVYALLPFLIQLAFDTFENIKWARAAQQHRRVRFRDPDAPNASVDEDDDEDDVLKEPPRAPDLVQLMLPGLCHLTSEEEARVILLKAGLEDLLLQYVGHQWLTYTERRRPPRARRRSKVLEATLGANSGPTARELQQVEEELTTARSSLLTAFNVFLNLAVLEPNRIAEGGVYRQLTRLVLSAAPDLSQPPRDMPLQATASVLGLMLLRQSSRPKTQQSEPDIPTSFLQPVLRFLWDAHEIDTEDGGEGEGGRLCVAREYRPHWADVMELWFLGLQTLGALLHLCPWLPDFLLDSGFAAALLDLILRTKQGQADGGVMTALEDFLCHLAKSSNTATNFLRENGALSACQSHTLKELTPLLMGDETK